MTREEEIKQAYLDWVSDIECSEYTIWKDAVKWADEHRKHPETPGKARLLRKLKKATKKYLRYHNKTSMVIMPQAQFVCFNKKGQLIVCHAKYCYDYEYSRIK